LDFRIIIVVFFVASNWVQSSSRPCTSPDSLFENSQQLP
jgi:hypothetical protein